MNSDLTFITNEKGQSLKERFEVLIKDTKFFDCLVGDFYAGLVGDFTNASSWKKLRVTAHDHNPVNDAMGNLEAFERILKGER